MRRMHYGATMPPLLADCMTARRLDRFPQVPILPAYHVLSCWQEVVDTKPEVQRMHPVTGTALFLANKKH